MDQDIEQSLRDIARRIAQFGKEGLDEMLHLLLGAAGLATGVSHLRLYLEDLTSGSLSCFAALGPDAERLRGSSYPINAPEYLVSRTYVHRQEQLVEDMDNTPGAACEQLDPELGLRACCMLPLLHRERPFGVLCLDTRSFASLPAHAKRRRLQDFLSETAPHLDQARKYHQQLHLARRVDKAKKKEAALHMVKSAVRLVSKLKLASVLLPVGPGPEASGGLEILASYSEEPRVARLYNEERRIRLNPGTSLLSRYIDDQNIIIDEQFLRPLYFSDLTSESLQKRYITEELGLRSLYVVPRFEAGTRRIICIVNYYSSDNQPFSETEKGLLESHAEMAQRVIQEIGDEHMEIQVLSEIGDLLQEKFSGVQPFLNRILSKARELIGADTGSIALVEQREGQSRLLVEDGAGNLVGAKSKEWMKRHIPPFRVGGHDLPPSERSLTGYCAHTAAPQILPDTQLAKLAGGFHQEISEMLRSEIAVPLIYDDRVLAVICLNSLRVNYFTEEHQRILTIISRMISRHLANLQRIEQLTSEVRLLEGDVDYRDPKISSYKLGNIIGNSPKAAQLVDFIQTITPPLFNRIRLWRQPDLQEAILGLPCILVTGATGSGKEFMFNNIYSRLNEMYREQFGGRGELPVKKTNIAAYSGELTYSELFGHKRGAFTGAHTDRKGIFEEAHGGVVFLDEIGDADPKTQVQLLRFLDSGSVVRLGENSTRYARVLLVAATNKNLDQLMQTGAFRSDLFHRLSELTIEVPSLNDRREDIPDLAVHFLGKLFGVYKGEGEEIPSLTKAARSLLSSHHYSGNIRELRSILLRALMVRKGRIIDAEQIRQAIGSAPTPATLAETGERLSEELAQQLFEQLRAGRLDFWEGLYNPYSENRLSRDSVRRVVELARSEGATNMPKVARMLGACDPASADEEQQRTFYRFKNFLYKTIRIA